MIRADVLQCIYIACAAVVTVRVICVGFKVSRDGWTTARFAVFSLGCVLKMFGALSFAAGSNEGAGLMLIGTVLAMADRRSGVSR